MATSGECYAYIHARPNLHDADSVFYVGKGTFRRSASLAARNPHHGNIVKKYGKENILVGKLACSSESIAFDLEKGLIKCMKRMGVKLTNQTDGGEGVSGLVMSDDAKAKMSYAKKGKPGVRLGVPHTPETKAKLAGIASNISEETRKKISESGLGRKHTDETKAKMSAARRGKPAPANASREWSFKGKVHSEESKLKMSEAKVGRPMHPATRVALLRALSNQSKETIELRASKLRGVVRPQHVIDAGRTPSALAKRSAAMSLLFWINDGIKSNRVTESVMFARLLNGWRRGRI